MALPVRGEICPTKSCSCMSAECARATAASPPSQASALRWRHDDVRIPKRRLNLASHLEQPAPWQPPRNRTEPHVSFAQGNHQASPSRLREMAHAEPIVLALPENARQARRKVGIEA